jgi:hypothetical protein
MGSLLEGVRREAWSAVCLEDVLLGYARSSRHVDKGRGVRNV